MVPPGGVRWCITDVVLSGLLLLDVLLAAWALLAPDLWFRAFHGIEYHDPQGFLGRCGANWAAFALFEGVALVRWRRQKDWLAVAAGLRLSDIFTDWTYFALASNVSVFGTIALLSASPANVAIGVWLLREYRKSDKTSRA